LDSPPEKDPIDCASVGRLIHSGVQIKTLPPNMGNIDEEADLNTGKNSAVIELSRGGRLKGGKARPLKITKEILSAKARLKKKANNSITYTS